jgi:hypothetical protein
MRTQKALGRSVAVAVLLVLSATASAQGLPAAPEAAGIEEKKICRSEKLTGSLTRVRRVCLTASEWDDLRRNTKHSLEDQVRGAAGGKECVLDGNGGCK